MIEKLEAPDGYVFVCVHCAEEIAIKLDDVGKVENNEAHALADELDRVLQVSGCDNRVPRMLRQLADKISNMEVWEKKYLDRIAELEFENKAFRDELFSRGSMDSCSKAAAMHGFVSPRQAGDDAREYIAEILRKASKK